MTSPTKPRKKLKRVVLGEGFAEFGWNYHYRDLGPISISLAEETKKFPCNPITWFSDFRKVEGKEIRLIAEVLE